MVTSTAPFLSLPSELIHQILTFLPFSDLLSVGLVSQALHEHTLQDTLWQPLVQFHVPGSILANPANLTWRELFKTHHPYWFIPQRKIWFSDHSYYGKLAISRYNHRINAIEAYPLIAEAHGETLQTWDWNPGTIIYTFSPEYSLDLGFPVIDFNPMYLNSEKFKKVKNRLQQEMPMRERVMRHLTLCNSLALTRPWPVSVIGESTPVWPPLIFPSSVRARQDSSNAFQDPLHRPSKLAELSTGTFRTRRWAVNSPRHGQEEVITWATLPEECYTPTAKKPWQGIWCGGYATHGCEFLLITQPDDPKPLPESAEWAMRAREGERQDTGIMSESDFLSMLPMEVILGEAEAALEEARGELGEEEIREVEAELEEVDMTYLDNAAELENSVSMLQGPAHEASFTEPPVQMQEEDSPYHGRIEAIKLTGDPNVPRGQYTFIAPDIGPNGLVRVATEDLFKGARIVKSVGHVADRLFSNGEYSDNLFSKLQMLIWFGRSLHRDATHHDLARPTCAILGRIWPRVLL
jgi:hypothetical protein